MGVIYFLRKSKKSYLKINNGIKQKNTLSEAVARLNEIDVASLSLMLVLFVVIELPNLLEKNRSSVLN